MSGFLQFSQNPQLPDRCRAAPADGSTGFDQREYRFHCLFLIPAIDSLHISFFQITNDIFCHPFFCVLQHRISPLQLPDHRFPDASHSKSVKSTTVLYGIFSSDNSYSYTVTTFSVLIVAYYSHILQFLLKYFILESISMLLFVPCANSGIGVHPPRCVTTRNTILGKRKIF